MAIIILWSLLVTMVFSFFAGKLGEEIGYGPLFFSIIAIGYILIIAVLTLIFSHRLIGPFQRLKTEIKLVRTGDYAKRLNIRNNDDMYLRTFVEEVNSILDELEKVQDCRERLNGDIENEFSALESAIEKGDATGEELKKVLVSFHEKAKTILDEDRQ